MNDGLLFSMARGANPQYSLIKKEYNSVPCFKFNGADVTGPRICHTRKYSQVQYYTMTQQHQTVLFSLEWAVKSFLIKILISYWTLVNIETSIIVLSLLVKNLNL